MYKIETHAHTSETSPCSHINATELITEYKKKGYSAVIITDHFIEKNFLALSQSDVQSRFLKGFDTALSCGEKLGITVLLGAEIRFTNSKEDYLVYGIGMDFFFTHFDIYKNGRALSKRSVSHRQRAISYSASTPRATRT